MKTLLPFPYSFCDKYILSNTQNYMIFMPETAIIIMRCRSAGLVPNFEACVVIQITVYFY